MRTQITKFLIIWIVLAAVIAGWRWKGGGHYLPVSIRITAVDKTDSVRVWLVSPFGTSRELTVDHHDPQMFIPEDYHAGPVEGLAVSGLSDRDVLSLHVLCGESDPGVGSIYKTVDVWQTQREITIPFDGTYSLIKPLSFSSRLPGIPSRCLNWGGDFSFVAYSLLVGMLLTLLVLTALSCLQRDNSNAPKIQTKQYFGTPLRSLSGALRIATLMILVHQLYNITSQLVNCRNASEGIVSLAISILLLLLAINLGQGSDKPSTVNLIAWFAGGVLLLCRWFVAGRFPLLQTGDYGTYHRVALQMLRGDWHLLNTGFFWDMTYAERVLGWNLCNAWVSNQLASSPLMLNQVLFLLTMVFLFHSVSRLIHRKIALTAAGLWAVYPDVFFGGHLLRHDNPAILMLLLYLYLLTAYCIRNVEVSASPSVEGRPARWRILVPLGILGGCIELQRSYLPFLFCCTVMSVLLEIVLLNRSEFRTSVLSRIKTACPPVCSFVIAILIAWSGRYFLQSRCGTFTTLSYADMISCWDYDSDGSWATATPWLDSYTKNTSSEQRTELLLRKLCDAKLGRPVAFLEQLSLKNSLLSGVRSAIRMSGGREPGEMFPSVFNVPYAAGKFAFGHAIVCILLTFAIARTLAVHQPLSVFERVMFLFSLSFILPILLLTEAAEQYDLVLSIPLAVNAAVQLGNLKRPRTSDHPDKPVRRKEATTVWLGGLTICTCMTVIWLSACKVVQANPKLTFAEAGVISVSDNAELRAGRHAYCLEARDRVLPANDELVAELSVPTTSLSGDRLRFFVSLDQRRKRMFWEFPTWITRKIYYSITVDGNEVSAGPIGTLRYAAFVDAPVDRKPGIIPIVLRIRTEEDTTTGEDALGVAIEYLH